MTAQEKYADKIAKLLAKAQSTPFEGEALTFTEKAQELMHKYAIDAALIDAARGLNSKEREEIIEARWEYTGTYRQAAWRLANVVARANGCKTLLSDDATGRKAQLYVIGYEGDVERARTLETSLQLQMTVALSQWWKSNDIHALFDRNRKFAERRQFMFSFADGVSGRLKTAKVKAEKTANAEHGAESVALVIRNRADNVDAWIDQQYGRLRHGSSRSYKAGGNGARVAGQTAGARADVGQPRMGSRKALKS
jgi:hypothetical protein